MCGTEQQLLFGIVAWQLKFVNAEQLTVGFQAWIKDKESPLAAHLVSQGALSPDLVDLLDPLIKRHIEEHGNDSARSLAALSSVEPVRRVLAELASFDTDLAHSLSLLEEPKPQFSGKTTIEPAFPAISQATVIWPIGSINQQSGAGNGAQGSRFHIIRPHAEGGLGRVYVAHDTELGRKVALKEIKPQFSDQAESRRRFVLEAEITGGLQHPGIVPVYGLGAYEDGRPFYAMQFIEGDSLQHAIARFHRRDKSTDFTTRNQELRDLLGRLIDVCQAVAFAHSRGVLHRDLKPGNIMLGKYGETLVVDWGLAKSIDGDFSAIPLTDLPAPTENDVEDHPIARGETAIEATRAGSALGTPHYMSPEQAAGRIEELGPTTDVYSLGATLYELLAGKPPFSAWTGVATLEQRLDDVQQGRFPRIHEINRHVPRALEAICLKAMAQVPDQRYPSPLQLAADIEHWLADEPLSAQCEPVLGRMARWSRKHPSLLTGAMVLAVASSIGILMFYLQNQALMAAKLQADKSREESDQNRAAAVGQLSIAKAERLRADEQKTRAQHNANQLRMANAQVAATSLVATTARDRAQQLAEYSTRLASHAEDQQQKALLTLNELVSGVNQGLEKLPGSQELRQKLLPMTLRAVDQMATQYVQRGVRDGATAAALMEMGDVVLQFGRGSKSLRTLDPKDEDTQSSLPLARRVYRAAFDIRMELAAGDLNDRQLQFELAKCHMRLGEVDRLDGHSDTAEMNFERAREVLEQLSTLAPDDQLLRHQIAMDYSMIGDLCLNAGKIGKARQACEKSRRVFQLLTAEMMDEEFHAEIHRLEECLRDVGIAEKVVQSLQFALTQTNGTRDVGRWLQIRIKAKLYEARENADRLLTVMDEIAQTAAAIGQLKPEDKANWHASARAFAQALQELDAAKSRESTAGQLGIAHSANATAAREKYVKAGLDSLRQAVRAGWSDPDILRIDPVFRVLSDLPEFKSLLEPLKDE